MGDDREGLCLEHLGSVEEEDVVDKVPRRRQECDKKQCSRKRATALRKAGASSEPMALLEDGVAHSEVRGVEECID